MLALCALKSDNELMNRQPVQRIPAYKPADCLGEDCFRYEGTPCDSRLELLESSGGFGGRDLAPIADGCSYALYGQVCMANEVQLVIRRQAVSPNGRASPLELAARIGRNNDIGTELNTSPEEIVFES